MNFGFGRPGGPASEYSPRDSEQFRDRVRRLPSAYLFYQRRGVRARLALWAAWYLVRAAWAGGEYQRIEPPHNPRAGALEPPSPVVPFLSRRAAQEEIARVGWYGSARRGGPR